MVFIFFKTISGIIYLYQIGGNSANIHEWSSRKGFRSRPD